MADQRTQLSRRSALRKGALATGALLVGGTGTAAAAPVRVPADYSSIQAAVDAASAGDTVVVDGSAGPYREQVIVRKDLTVRGVDDPTLLPPSGGLGVSDIAVIQPIFGAVGYGNEVTFEGFTVDGENATDKGGFYSGFGYYKADGEVADVTARRAEYGGYVSQNRGGGGSQSVAVSGSRFEELGYGGGVLQQLVFNEPGTEGTVTDCTFVGDPGKNFLYGVTAGYGGIVDARRNTFRDFYGGSFQLGFYAFDSPDCSIQHNTFQDVQYPVYANATSTAGPSTSAGEHRITRNTFAGSGIPSGDTSYGTTIYANDLDSDDGKTETANNVKIVNNDYSNLDNGVATFEAGEGEVRNTKIIRNDFDEVDTPVTSNGDGLKQQANRVD